MAANLTTTYASQILDLLGLSKGKGRAMPPPLPSPDKNIPGMYVCMYVCMYVYMYVCIYVYVCICMYGHLSMRPLLSQQLITSCAFNPF